MKSYTLYALCALFTLLINADLSAQMKGGDQIITVTGKIIKGNVKKIGNDEVSYRKYFHKYTVKTDKVLYIVYSNGSKKVVNDITLASHYQNYSQNAKNKPVTDSVPKNTGFKPHYIERVGSSFRLDTSRIVGPKVINDLASQNPNPIVQVNLKTAKLMHTLTTISKITSYPSSAGGAFASYKTFSALFEQMKSGPVTFNYYLNAGLSFLGTLSVPITTGILKKVQRKMYDKMLTLYSM